MVSRFISLSRLCPDSTNSIRISCTQNPLLINRGCQRNINHDESHRNVSVLLDNRDSDFPAPEFCSAFGTGIVSETQGLGVSVGCALDSNSFHSICLNLDGIGICHRL